MIDNRYKDKNHLIKFNLSTDLFDMFNLKVNDVVPMRDVYKLFTDKGEKVLKKVDYTTEELEYIYSAILYIKQRFSRIIDFVKTKDNKVFTTWKGDIYCVMDLVPGRECEFSNPIDIEIASEGIGELHNSSEGFRSSLCNKNICGYMIDNFKRRLQEMQFFVSIANLHQHKNAFDNIFLNNVDYYMNDIRKAIDILDKSPYYKLCSEEDKVVLCHHDLAHHNILIQEEKAYFIDFDYSIVDLKVHDLCNFITKVIKDFAFDIDKAISIINSYCKQNTLDKRELEVLYGMLSFPEDFYSICRDYYTKRKEWDEEVFIERLIRKADYKEDREEFLEEFEKRLLK